MTPPRQNQPMSFHCKTKKYWHLDLGAVLSITRTKSQVWDCTHVSRILGNVILWPSGRGGEPGVKAYAAPAPPLVFIESSEASEMADFGGISPCIYT